MDQIEFKQDRSVQIVSVAGGWNFAGRLVTRPGPGVHVHRMQDTFCIENWGTDDGIGQIGDFGPRQDTRLREMCAGGEVYIPANTKALEWWLDASEAQTEAWNNAIKGGYKLASANGPGESNRSGRGGGPGDGGDSGVPKGLRMTIIAVAGGWNFVGQLLQEPDPSGWTVEIAHCMCIENWGTTKGIGQLLNEGPQRETRLRAMCRKRSLNVPVTSVEWWAHATPPVVGQWWEKVKDC